MKLDPTNQLREWLGDGKYTKGSKLPSERALAEELGITRPLRRKALSKLEAENLIWRHIGKGTFVGTTTDVNGSYSLDVDGNATVVVAYIGYKTQELATSGGSGNFAMFLGFFCESQSYML